MDARRLLQIVADGRHCHKTRGIALVSADLESVFPFKHGPIISQKGEQTLEFTRFLRDLNSGTCETPSDTLVLTWQNALLNRDSNSLVNIQAELFSLGEMRVAHDISVEVET